MSQFTPIAAKKDVDVGPIIVPNRHVMRAPMRHQQTCRGKPLGTLTTGRMT